MRVDKLLSNMGYGSRKDVKKFLKKGIVYVDDQIVKDGKIQINVEKNVVTVAGEVVEYKPYLYLMMNKPKGVISATEDDIHRTVIDLLEESHAMYQPFPVGRLDKDTTGMLLITNDGQFSHALMSPKREVPKTYRAEVRGEMDNAHIEQFKRGVTLEDGYETKPAILTILKKGDVSTVELTITEGKFHQVKRMFQAIGSEVLTLHRKSIGSLQLDPRLGEGAYRELTEGEYELLMKQDPY